jgi:hypothetical protein
MSEPKYGPVPPGPSNIEWARINEEDERHEAESARAMSVSERLEFGQNLCDQGFKVLNAAKGSGHDTWKRDPRA